MAKNHRNLVEDLRGASRLAIEATQGITAVVEEMHRTIGSGPAILGRPLAGPVGAVTRVVYGGVGGAAGLAGSGVDKALARLAAMIGGGTPTPEHEAVLAAVNGVLGDYLEATDNPLAIPMSVRVQGQAVPLDSSVIAAAIPAPTSRLLVTVHGSSMNARQWMRRGHHHGRALVEDLGFTLMNVQYNSGRHISTNGLELAGTLQALMQAWPGPPVDELVLLTHSMGGLVARSACLAAEVAGLAWRDRLRAIVFLGTPHHGAPLERGGNWVDVLLGVHPYSAPLARLARIRSAGVTDLRHGSLRDQDWAGRDRFVKRPDPREPVPLPDGVRCFAVAGKTRGGVQNALPGDGLVPVASALGQHKQERFRLAFGDGDTWVAEGTSHLDLLSSPEVYERVCGWLESG